MGQRGPHGVPRPAHRQAGAQNTRTQWSATMPGARYLLHPGTGYLVPWYSQYQVFVDLGRGLLKTCVFPMQLGTDYWTYRMFAGLGQRLLEMLHFLR